MCTVGKVEEKWSKDKVRQSQTHVNGCFGETYKHRTEREAKKFCMGQRKDSKISGILSVDGNLGSFLHWIAAFCRGASDPHPSARLYLRLPLS